LALSAFPFFAYFKLNIKKFPARFVLKKFGTLFYFAK